jgi:hypothetical protein
MPQHPKRNLAELNEHELRAIVADVQEILWVDEPPGGGEEFWNNEKLLSLNMLLVISRMLEAYGLKPIDPPLVRGFDSIDEFIEALPKDAPPDEQPFPEIDRSDNEDPDYWQGQPGGNPPTS